MHLNVSMETSCIRHTQRIQCDTRFQKDSSTLFHTDVKGKNNLELSTDVFLLCFYVFEGVEVLLQIYEFQQHENKNGDHRHDKKDVGVIEYRVQGSG